MYDWLRNPDSRHNILVSYQQRNESGDWKTVRRATVRPMRKHKIRPLASGQRVVILTELSL